MTKSSIVTYPAVFHDNEVGGYTVTFPDIEDATTSGQTLGEVWSMRQSFSVRHSIISQLYYHLRRLLLN